MKFLTEIPLVVFMYSLVSVHLKKNGHSFSDFVLTVCSYRTNGKFWGIAIAYKMNRNMQLDKNSAGAKVNWHETKNGSTSVKKIPLYRNVQR